MALFGKQDPSNSLIEFHSKYLIRSDINGYGRIQYILQMQLKYRLFNNKNGHQNTTNKKLCFEQTYQFQQQHHKTHLIKQKSELPL